MSLVLLHLSWLCSKHCFHISWPILGIQQFCGYITIKKLNISWTRLQLSSELLNPIWSEKLSLPWNQTNSFDFPKGISSGRCMVHNNCLCSLKLWDRWPAAYLSTSWRISQALWHFPLLSGWIRQKTKTACLNVCASWVAFWVLRTLV